MQISNRRIADVAVVTLSGRIDHPNAQRLEHALAPMLDEASAGDAALLLDLSAVDYISSMGLRVLMVAAKRMRSCGKRIAVAELQPVVVEIFSIARFGNVLEIFPTMRAALDALSPTAAATGDGIAP